MTARVKVAMALRRSTRNSRAIMALNVLIRVGRGLGASAIRAATCAGPGGRPPGTPRSPGGPPPPAPPFGGGHSGGPPPPGRGDDPQEPPAPGGTHPPGPPLWWWSLAVLPSGQGEENCLQAGLELGRVTYGQPGGGTHGHELTEHALRFAGEDPDVIPVGFDFTDPGPFGQSCFLGDAVRHGFLVPDRDDRFRARAVLQLVHGA